MSLAILGGLLLNIGAYFTYKGQVYQAVIIYLFADVCWVVMAYQRDDMLGTAFILIGTILGFLAYLKMRNGVMNKSLNKNENDV